MGGQPKNIMPSAPFTRWTEAQNSDSELYLGAAAVVGDEEHEAASLLERGDGALVACESLGGDADGVGRRDGAVLPRAVAQFLHELTASSPHVRQADVGQLHAVHQPARLAHRRRETSRKDRFVNLIHRHVVDKQTNSRYGSNKKT